MPFAPTISPPLPPAHACREYLRDFKCSMGDKCRSQHLPFDLPAVRPTHLSQRFISGTPPPELVYHKQQAQQGGRPQSQLALKEMQQPAVGAPLGFPQLQRAQEPLSREPPVVQAFAARPRWQGVSAAAAGAAVAAGRGPLEAAAESQAACLPDTSLVRVVSWRGHWVCACGVRHGPSSGKRTGRPKTCKECRQSAPCK